MSKYIVQYDPTTPVAGDQLLLERGNTYYKFDWQKVIDVAGGGGSPLTTKGDLFTYAAADARLPVGGASQILTVDAAEATGLKWINRADTGIYIVDGTIQGTRTITQGANTVSWTGTAVNGFSVNGTTLSVDMSNGRVGVGTAAPSALFNLQGGIMKLENVAAGNANVFEFNGTTKNANFAFQSGGVTKWFIVNRTDTTSNLSIRKGSASGVALFEIQQTDGAIGIGIAAPTAGLHVFERTVKFEKSTNDIVQIINASAGNLCVLDIESKTGAGSSNLEWTTNGVRKWALRNDVTGASDAFMFRTAVSGFNDADVLMDITQVGRLGLKVLAPESALEITPDAGGTDKGGITLGELAADHSAPSVDKGVMYLKDVGAKTALFIRFNTGAVQQIAIEP